MMGISHDDLCIIVLLSHWIILRMINVLGKHVGKLITHILRSVTVVRKLYRLWDNVEKFSRAG